MPNGRRFRCAAERPSLRAEHCTQNTTSWCWRAVYAPNDLLGARRHRGAGGNLPRVDERMQKRRCAGVPRCGRRFTGGRLKGSHRTSSPGMMMNCRVWRAKLKTIEELIRRGQSCWRAASNGWLSRWVDAARCIRRARAARFTLRDSGSGRQYGLVGAVTAVARAGVCRESQDMSESDAVRSRLRPSRECHVQAAQAAERSLSRSCLRKYVFRL